MEWAFLLFKRKKRKRKKKDYISKPREYGFHPRSLEGQGIHIPNKRDLGVITPMNLIHL
jgi:hypothetical protein